MATYHVRHNPETNTILAGTLNKAEDKFTNSTDATEECLLAVRNHFLQLADKEQTNEVGYQWEFDNGTKIFLKVVVETKDNKEE